MVQLQTAANQAVWEQICRKVDAVLPRMADKCPHVAQSDGIYDDTRLDWWTSGFWPGILWIMHDMTGEQRYKDASWSWDERMERLFLTENRYDHDVGFQFLPTAVIKHTITGDKDGARRGLFAANFLAGRFNLKGNFIRAWKADKTGWSIVDTAMNLSLLFWAAKESQDPRFMHVAKAHADTVVRHFIREDGSAYHIVRFHPETGERADAIGGQGAAPDSAWSRGAAWALYGMTNAYTHTGDESYLRAAQRVANFFIAHLPEDGVPYWDFRADEEEGGIPRDSSAGACAASGLIDLAGHLPDQEGRGYLAAAERILGSLYQSYGTWDNSAHEGMLLQGTGNRPADENVNVSLIYGDYFFVEATAKLNGWKHRIF
ncbi:glycoside hydrolase family 88 protein [Paenibacillus sp. 453mf]|uniref:glycoside hydrolase family 88 protein n=1 Tax=Paenibacillus sp. 453mf TaxID=1761874 RepID=UPI0008E7CBD2|nr:glycoside hydrolase family 88 protein [Paenibacillus sp. 453mf]SFS86871.1 unsaturated chondroitin disaccharide hydrolase [Paenibacillus sp. 453mf]